MTRTYGSISVDFTEKEWAKVQEIQSKPHTRDRRVNVKRANEYTGPRVDFSKYSTNLHTVSVPLQHIIKMIGQKLNSGPSI